MIWRWILREILWELAIGAIFSPNDSPPQENNSYYQEEYHIEEVERPPNYDDILDEEVAEYVSSFLLAENPISSTDLKNNFLGLYNEGFASFTINPMSEEPSDTIYFSYRMLFDDAKKMNQGNGVVIATENLIAIDRDDSFDGQIYKVRDEDTGQKYLLFSIPMSNGSEMMFLDSQAAYNLNR